MSTSKISMQGKICLVTGANSGIGKATALGLAQMGARLGGMCKAGALANGNPLVPERITAA